MVPALVGPLAALHDIVDLRGGAGRVARLVQGQASDLVDELEGRFGVLGDASQDALDAGKDYGHRARDQIDDLF
jgi:hypothetical protein